jgi:hypothetical protein
MSKENYNHLMKLLACKEYRQLELKGYMPLAVEKLGEEAISLCHRGELNGDYMRDPEIVFLVKDGEATAVYFRNDWAAFEYATVPEMFGDVPVRPLLQRDLNSFASTWFQNLKEQGFFEQAKEFAKVEQDQEHEEDHEISR